MRRERLHAVRRMGLSWHHLFGGGEVDFPGHFLALENFLLWENKHAMRFTTRMAGDIIGNDRYCTLGTCASSSCLKNLSVQSLGDSHITCVLIGLRIASVSNIEISK
jgi:hypothetical protein